LTFTVGTAGTGSTDGIFAAGNGAGGYVVINTA
jgi:hypothetical protein